MSARRLVSVLAPFALLLCEPVGAHPLAPALLEISEIAPAQYSVLWRTSVSRVQRVDVEPVLPESCAKSQAVESAVEEGERLSARWTVQCGPEGLAGKTISVAGIEQSGINVILRIESKNGRAAQTLLAADRPVFTVPAASTAPPVFRTYLSLGVEHLLLGFDHVLFVIGLLLLVRRLRPLLITITAFTLGHSVTLALATLGVLRVNSVLMELGIALSVLILACQLVRAPGQEPSLLARRPWLMACTFGLLHGLGFAGALGEIGLPGDEIPLALFGFNLGIELGQLLLVAPMVLLGVFARQLPGYFSAGFAGMARILPVYLIGSLAAFWCFERAAMLLSA